MVNLLLRGIYIKKVNVLNLSILLAVLPILLVRLGKRITPHLARHLNALGLRVLSAGYRLGACLLHARLRLRLYFLFITRKIDVYLFLLISSDLHNIFFN